MIQSSTSPCCAMILGIVELRIVRHRLLALDGEHEHSWAVRILRVRRPLGEIELPLAHRLSRLPSHAEVRGIGVEGDAGSDRSAASGASAVAIIVARGLSGSFSPAATCVYDARDQLRLHAFRRAP